MSIARTCSASRSTIESRAPADPPCRARQTNRYPVSALRSRHDGPPRRRSAPPRRSPLLRTRPSGRCRHPAPARAGSCRVACTVVGRNGGLRAGPRHGRAHRPASAAAHRPDRARFGDPEALRPRGRARRRCGAGRSRPRRSRDGPRPKRPSGRHAAGAASIRSMSRSPDPRGFGVSAACVSGRAGHRRRRLARAPVAGMRAGAVFPRRSATPRRSASR